MKDYGIIKLDDLATLNSLSGGALKLLIMCARDCEYPASLRTFNGSGNVILITPQIKMGWAVERDLSVSAIANMLTELVQTNHLRKIQGGVYLLNPNVIYKGPAINEPKAIEEWDK